MNTGTSTTLPAGASAAVTYLVRHGQTALNPGHIVNSDPGVEVSLDDVGVRQCASITRQPWLDTVIVCVTSRFARTAQTAVELLGDRRPRRVAESGLDEIDYGRFDGGPWIDYGNWVTAEGRFARPPGARESLHEATVRLREGLDAALDLPGPRLVVGHGLMVAIVRHLRDHPDHLPDHLPPPPHVSPIRLPDTELRAILDTWQVRLSDLAAPPAHR
jgi:probable phosphoglycerate mutase